MRGVIDEWFAEGGVSLEVASIRSVVVSLGLGDWSDEWDAIMSLFLSMSHRSNHIDGR